jgi:hypothetical protein
VPSAILFANGIGDHIMTLPALRALASVLPSPVGLYAMPELRRVVLTDVDVAGDVPIRLYSEEGRNRLDLPADDPYPNVDVFASLNPWHSPDVDVLSDRLRPTLSVGMCDKFDIHVESVPGEHSCDRAFRVAQALDPSLQIDDFSRPPRISDEALRVARSMLEQVGERCYILAVHNETLPHKVWSRGRHDEALTTFLSSHPDFASISLDRDSVPLDVALALVSLSDLFLGVDSCMLHMADICRVPGVGLFGPDPSAPTGSSVFGFRFGCHREVSGHGSMDGIAVAQVLGALDELVPTMPATPRRHLRSQRTEN